MRILSCGGVAVIMIVASMLVPNVTVAQDGKVQNSLVDGKSALLFEINGDIDLTSFEGATLSLKHHVSDNRAYRLSLTTNFSSQDSESRSDVPGISYDVDSYALSLFLNRLYYHSPNAATTVFYGFGPRSGVSAQKSTSVNPLNGIRTESTTDGWDVGLIAVLGFEWFVRREISLIAQYASSFRYVSSSHESRSGFDSTGTLELDNLTETKRWQFDADAVRFGVSLYW